MEVLIEGSTYNTIIINIDSEFGSNFIQVSVVLLVSSFISEDKQITTILNIFNKVINFLRTELILGWSQDKQVRLLNFIELDRIFI